MTGGREGRIRLFWPFALDRMELKSPQSKRAISFSFHRVHTLSKAFEFICLIPPEKHSHIDFLCNSMTALKSKMAATFVLLNVVISHSAFRVVYCG